MTARIQSARVRQTVARTDAGPRPLGNTLGRVSPLKPGRRLMAELYDLKDAYDNRASSRVQRCGNFTTGSAVKVMQVLGHLPHYVGTQRCGLAWECPVCSARLKAARANEVRQAVEWHVERYGRESALLLTLTVRHHRGHDLEALRAGVAKAWQRFQAGKAWVAFKAEIGFVGTIRALELTHGDDNGWHPHLHIALLVRRPRDLDDAARAWLFRRWAAAVRRCLGEEHAPLEFDPATGRPLGVDLRVCHQADYLAKLGLEVSSPNTKRARGAHRTPLQILADFADAGVLSDLLLYRDFAEAMKGARQLTWSKGLKRMSGVIEQSDEEIIEGEERGAVNVAMIAKDEWAGVRWIPGAKAAVLEFAERFGAEGVFALVDTYRGRPSGVQPGHRLLTEPEMIVAVRYSSKVAVIR